MHNAVKVPYLIQNQPSNLGKDKLPAGRATVDKQEPNKLQYLNFKTYEKDTIENLTFNFFRNISSSFFWLMQDY